MAIKTMIKKIADAKKKHEAELETLGLRLQKEIADVLSPLIPQGWYLTWCQSDEQYDDENYYFGLDSERLISVNKPRKGKLLKAEVPRKTEMVTARQPYQSYSHTYEKVIEYGSPAEYEWILDEKCKPRSKRDDLGYEESGVIHIGEDCDESPENEMCGLTEDDFSDLRTAFQEIGEDLCRHAFGDVATVRIDRDGTCTVS